MPTSPAFPSSTHSSFQTPPQTVTPFSSSFPSLPQFEIRITNRHAGGGGVWSSLSLVISTKSNFVTNTAVSGNWGLGLGGLRHCTRPQTLSGGIRVNFLNIALSAFLGDAICQWGTAFLLKYTAARSLVVRAMQQPALHRGQFWRSNSFFPEGGAVMASATRLQISSSTFNGNTGTQGTPKNFQAQPCKVFSCLFFALGMRDHMN